MYLTCSSPTRIYKDLLAYIGNLPVCSSYVAGMFEHKCQYSRSYLPRIGDHRLYNISNIMLPTVHIDHSPFSFNSLGLFKTFGRGSEPNIVGKLRIFVGHSVHVPVCPFHVPVCPFHVPVCAFHGVSTVLLFLKNIGKRVVF